jgi:hypothetical protein
VLKLTAVATAMVVVPVTAGVGADRHTVQMFDARLDARWDTFVQRYGHRPSEETYNTWLQETDNLIKDSLIMPKVSNIIQTISGYRSRRS